MQFRRWTRLILSLACLYCILYKFVQLWVLICDWPFVSILIDSLCIRHKGFRLIKIVSTSLFCFVSEIYQFRFNEYLLLMVITESTGTFWNLKAQFWKRTDISNKYILLSSILILFWETWLKLDNISRILCQNIQFNSVIESIVPSIQSTIPPMSMLKKALSVSRCSVAKIFVR